MKTLALIACMIIFSASAEAATSTFRINAPTKEDTIIHTPRESAWAEEDKNPVADFFANLFKPASQPAVEIKAAEVKPAEPQHIASVDLTDK